MYIVMMVGSAYRRALLTVRSACSQHVRKGLKPQVIQLGVLCRFGAWILHEYSRLLQTMHMLLTFH